MLNRYIVTSLLCLCVGASAHNAQLQLLTHIASNNSCAKDKQLKKAVHQNITDIIYGKSCQIDPKLIAPLLLKQQTMLSNDRILLHTWQTHNQNLVDTKFRWIPRVSLTMLATSFAYRCYKTYTATDGSVPDKVSDHVWALLNNVYVAGLHAGLAFATTGAVMVVKADIEQHSPADIQILQNKVAQTERLCKQLEQLIKK